MKYDISFEKIENKSPLDFKRALFKVVLLTIKKKYDLFRSPSTFDDYLKKKCDWLDKSLKKRFIYFEKYSLYYVLKNYDNFLYFDLEFVIYLLLLIDYKIDLYD